MALRRIAARCVGAQLGGGGYRAAGVVPVLRRQAGVVLDARAACCRTLTTYGRLLSSAPQNLVGADPSPSPKQLQFAHNLSEQHNVPMPDEAKSSAVLCSAFIDKVLEQNPTPPSEKQLAFVTKLCAERGQEVPTEVLVDRRKCSALIDELLGSASVGDENETSPSDKQILYAARLAREKGVGLSAEALSSKTAMSQLIDQLSAASQGLGGGTASLGGVESMGWQPAAPATPYPPPLEQRDDDNKGRYPY